MNYIMLLARLFSKEEWADDFLEFGKFRMNTLNSFKNYIDEYSYNIGDPLEGISSHYLGDHDVKLTIKHKNQVIDISDFVSLHIQRNDILYQNVFCMFAPSVIKDVEYTIESMTDKISLNEDTKKLGDHMVIIHKPEVFFERLKEASNKLNYILKLGLIDYRDFSKPIRLKDEEIGFVKSIDYAHQSEYRIMIDSRRNIDEHIDMQIGSLKDIAIKIKTEDFNNSFKITPKT
ncbi:hypothetical protein [Acinetobacter gerneri]|uniref:Uncharacterized protein n=1 Tax=Acinetobacter gerneri DSM 14967 = CIP 107464 = MTCC 9824 TaxID=1120926 RepID=N8ZGQ7_9GAMM|nr:hypothetical protein [Acinetobacter gerneri]ENV32929.1 hypothetical protein F960_02651 [Acinetobacter gerneri DSM 14967 = CIP 107464 = MTCC 9824]EPR84392.1 hypothetical protein L289_1369 [Acinetobacter gerneri DSM 14967 = CIP 107464 = MTCC 9824]